MSLKSSLLAARLSNVYISRNLRRSWWDVRGNYKPDYIDGKAMIPYPNAYKTVDHGAMLIVMPNADMITFHNNNHPLPIHFYSAEEQERDKLLREPIQIDTKPDISLISGATMEQLKERVVLIKMPTKNAMQSGTHNLHKWTMSYDAQPRWENRLMGWCSTGDPLSNMEIEFSAKEEAIDFCERNGWKYIIQEPHDSVQKSNKPKSYAANFSWNKRTRRSSK